MFSYNKYKLKSNYSRTLGVQYSFKYCLEYLI